MELGLLEGGKNGYSGGGWRSNGLYSDSLVMMMKGPGCFRFGL